MHRNPITLTLITKTLVLSLPPLGYFWSGGTRNTDFSWNALSETTTTTTHNPQEDKPEKRKVTSDRSTAAPRHATRRNNRMESVSMRVGAAQSARPRGKRRRKRSATAGPSLHLVLTSTLLQDNTSPFVLASSSCIAFSAPRLPLRKPRYFGQLNEALESTTTDVTRCVADKSNDTSRKYRSKRGMSVEIRSVDWCGYRGMLPLQRYRGTMANFDRWLCRPLNDIDETTNGDNIFNNGDTASIRIQQSEASQFIDHPDLSSLHNLTIQQQKQRKSQRKAEAERRASRPLEPRRHLKPIYIDEHIVAVSKASGALSVPGPRRNPSVANLCHRYLGNESDDVDKMAVHRLDLDTSGVVIYARSDLALGRLNDAFRSRNVKKKYQALLCGHLAVLEGEINVPLKRDRRSPPFMCVDTGEVEEENDDEQSADEKVIDKHYGYYKMMNKAAKPSLTLFHVLSFEYMDGLPVTRVELTPVTGRTHQLRVHCASIGHPIIGDDIYGIGGEGTSNGGLSDAVMDGVFPDRASLELQMDIDRVVQQRRLNASEKKDAADITGGPGNLCLHARILSLLHPLTNAPLAFEVDPPF